MAVGGRLGPVDFNIVRMYHIQENTWTVKNNFPYVMRFGIGYVLDRSSMFIHGGIIAPAGDIEKHNFEYDFDNDAWIQGVMLHRAYRNGFAIVYNCLLYTSPSPRDLSTSRMPSSA